MKHGSLFSGIGGFDLAAEWMGWENIFQVEIDPFCQKVLNKNFPNVKRYGDIKEFKGERGSVDILTGGFPCQPFSTAGKRKGESDDRYLWPEYIRIIREIKPTYVVGENVAGLVSMEDGKTLEGIFTDLEGEGYTVESFIIPACGVGAWHRRDRIWICAYSRSNAEGATHGKRVRRGEINNQQNDRDTIRNDAGDMGYKDVPDTTSTRIEGLRERENEAIDQSGNNNVPNTDRQGLEKRKGKNAKGTGSLPGPKSFRENQWDSEPGVGRVANGVPNRVDRLKGLGNAIVPQVAYEIFKAIDILLN